jgi:hypothetical protein
LEGEPVIAPATPTARPSFSKRRRRRKFCIGAAAAAAAAAGELSKLKFAV